MSREPCAPYEPSGRRTARQAWEGALVLDVDKGSPADRAGLEPGMVITHVNGAELRDIITWDWEADSTSVCIEGVAHRGQPDEFEFEGDIDREFGEDWGITFDGAVFDGMRLCRNDCSFCFMKMLPRGMRTSLYLRDDDYRLSFLQGNFVTLTNMSDEDVERVVTCALSPLNVSLHAITPQVRRALIGRNADRGIEVLEQLMAAGIEIHAQIVLVPGQNDGDELRRTLSYVEAHEAITSLGIVPLGFTKHQDTFSSSYSTDPEASAQVVGIVTEFQERSRALTGRTRYQLADEFYLFSHTEPPAASSYDGFPQYYDGIGMVRTFLDELDACAKDENLMSRLAQAASRLAAGGVTVLFVCGQASFELAQHAVDRLGMGPAARAVAVRNDYFGGNVDVSGLLTGQDVLNQLPEKLAGQVVVLPEVMLNADRLTLDGLTEEEMTGRLTQRGGAAVFAEASPQSMAGQLMRVAAGL